MSLWSKDKAPTFFPNAVATQRGWENPDTGEVLVAISELAEKGGGANISNVAFDETEYLQGAPLKVLVRFTEKVDVVAGATVEVSFSGTGGNFLATALAQDGVQVVEFDAVVPSEAGILSLAAQSILGTVTDDLGGDPADSLAISVSQANSAGSRTVA